MTPARSRRNRAPSSPKMSSKIVRGLNASFIHSGRAYNRVSAIRDAGCRWRTGQDCNHALTALEAGAHGCCDVFGSTFENRTCIGCVWLDESGPDVRSVGDGQPVNIGLVEARSRTCSHCPNSVAVVDCISDHSLIVQCQFDHRSYMYCVGVCCADATPSTSYRDPTKSSLLRSCRSCDFAL